MRTLITGVREPMHWKYPYILQVTIRNYHHDTGSTFSKCFAAGAILYKISSDGYLIIQIAVVQKPGYTAGNNLGPAASLSYRYSKYYYRCGLSVEFYLYSDY